MFGILLGLAVGNATEWLMHKYVLHGLGREKGSVWSDHLRTHHVRARKEGFGDEDYLKHPLDPSITGNEAEALTIAGLAHLPLLPVAPFYTVTIWYCCYNYWRCHRRSHQDEAWAKEHLPWHWDHHMGPNPEANWCVTRPWFDQIMGTREKYLGTKKELRDRKARAERRSAGFNPVEGKWSGQPFD